MNTDIGLLRSYFEKSDKTALDTLFSRHYPAVYQAVLHLVQNSFDARDLTQATFLKVIQAGRYYEPTGSFRNWILTIAINEVRQLRRGNRRAIREDKLFDLYKEADPKCRRGIVDDISRREFEQTLDLAIETLPDKLKEPLVLHYYQDLSFSEVGEILGIPKTTVQFRLESAVRKLRTFFKSRGYTSLIPLISIFLPLAAPASGSAIGMIVSSLSSKLGYGVFLMKTKTYGLVALLLILITGGVTITLFQMTKAEPIAGTDTADQRTVPAGTFQSEGLPGNPAEDEDYSKVPLSPTFEGIDPAIFGWVLEAGTRSPLPGAVIMAHDYEKKTTYRHQADENGFFRISETASSPRLYHLMIEKTGYGNTRAHGMQAGPDPHYFFLHHSGSIQGKVVWALDQSPVAPYTIMAILLDFPGTDTGNLHTYRLVKALPKGLVAEKEVKVNDPLGRFEISGLAPGKYVLVVTTQDNPPVFLNGGGSYYDRDMGFEVKAGQATPGLCIQLQRTGLLYLKVIDEETGKPIYGARVIHVVNLDNHSLPVPYENQTMSSDGLYELRLFMEKKNNAVEYAKLEVSKEGYVPNTLYLDGQAEGEIVTTVLTRGGRVQGTVWDSHGAPVTGAAVFIERETDRRLLDLVYTGPHGYYETRPFNASDDLVLYCFQRDLKRMLACVPFQVENNEVKTIDIGRQATCTIFGRVSFMGEPIPRALICLDSEQDQRIIIHTDDHGFYKIEHIAQGAFELFANIPTPSGGETYQTRFLNLHEQEQREANFDVGYLIKGKVKMANGNEPVHEIDGIEVSARQMGRPDSRDYDTARCNQDGLFELYVNDPGQYELFLVDETDYLVEEIPKVVLGPDQPTEEVALFLFSDPRDATIVLEVVDAESRRPILDGTVSCRFKRTSSLGWFENGEMVLSDRGVGTYHLEVNSDMHMAATLEVEVTLWEKKVKRTVALKRPDAIRIIHVEPGSNAFEAGLENGDIIITYGDQQVRNIEELRQGIRRVAPDQRVSITLVRKGQEQVFSVRGGRLGIRVEHCVREDS